MGEVSYNLLCFNTKNNCEKMINKSDLCFIQEYKPTNVDKNSLELLGYEVICLKESTNSANCLCYKKAEFILLKIDGKDCRLHDDEEQLQVPDILKSFKAMLPDALKGRVCLAILRCIKTSTKIIVASFHNPYMKTDGDSREGNATKLFSALDGLRQMTGYPVLVGGDFNCELLKDNVERSHFIVPQYNPTIHRVLHASGKGKICIDFFAYKNCDERRACSEIHLNNVEAKILSPHVSTLKINVEDYLDHKEYQRSKDSILAKIHAESDHDPLTAKLIIKKVSPIYRMICIFMNNPNDNLLGEIPISDFLLFHNINRVNFPLPTNYKSCDLLDTVKLYCDNNRLEFISNNKLNCNSLTCLVSELKSKVKNDQRFFVALFYQCNNQSVTNECVKKMFGHLTETCNSSATWIIGNVDINDHEYVKTLKLNNISIKQFQGGGNCFCASMNSKFSHAYFETIPTKFIEMNTNMELLYDNKKMLNSHGNLPFATTEMHRLVSVSLDVDLDVQETTNVVHDQSSQNELQDATSLNAETSHVAAKTDSPFQILCFNMSACNGDQSMSKIKCYFTKLDPKPDLFILQNLPDTAHYFTKPAESSGAFLQKPSQTLMCKILGVEESHDTCCRSKIVYNKRKFKLVSEIRAPSEFMITACILTCHTINNKPNIIVASFHNSNAQQETTKIAKDTMNFRKAEDCFKILEQLMILQYPAIVAGGFYIELGKEHKIKSDEGTSKTSESTKTCKIERKDFMVPTHNPLLHRVLHKVIKQGEDACIDTFAYKSSTYAIKLKDVHSEAIDPCPGLVTGAYNIDYDKGICNLPDMITKHDPVRAKMTVYIKSEQSTPIQ